MVAYNEYETIYILKPELPDDVSLKVAEKVLGAVDAGGGHVLRHDDWGKRKLAYPIQKHTRGHYVYVRHLSPGTLIAEMERQLRLDEDVLRFLTVRVDEDVDREQRLAEVSAEKESRLAAEQEAAAQAAEQAAAGESAETGSDATAPVTTPAG